MSKVFRSTRHRPREYWACPVCGDRVYRHIGGRDNWMCRLCTYIATGYEARARKPEISVRNRKKANQRAVRIYRPY